MKRMLDLLFSRFRCKTAAQLEREYQEAKKHAKIRALAYVARGNVNLSAGRISEEKELKARCQQVAKALSAR